MNLVLAVLLAANSVVISGPLTMAASTQKRILVVRIGATDVRHYDTAVGTKAHPTPMGRFTVKHRRHGRTRFCWTERLRFPWWMGGPIGERVAKPVLRRLWRGNLARLQRIAEAGT